MKFALISTILFLIVGASMGYVLLNLFEINMEVAAILTGIIAALIIVIVDKKKIHSHDKIVECNRRIVGKILSKLKIYRQFRQGS